MEAAYAVFREQGLLMTSYGWCFTDGPSAAEIVCQDHHMTEQVDASASFMTATAIYSTHKPISKRTKRELNKKTQKFVPYFTGEPLVRVEYSYTDMHMFQSIGGEVLSAEITEEQLVYLNSLHVNDQMAAHIFSDAYGPMRPPPEVRDLDRDYEDEGDS